MNLMEKYRRKYEAGPRLIKGDDQIMTPVISPVVANTIPEEVKEAFEERTAIMEIDGDLNRKEAESLAWCREVCMLSLAQRKHCELVIPCPKLVDLNG